jgi:hypothetical protein
MLFRPISNLLSKLQQDIVDVTAESPWRWFTRRNMRHTRKMVYINNPNEIFSQLNFKNAHLTVMEILNSRKETWLKNIRNCELSVDNIFEGGRIIITPPENIWIPIGDGIKAMINKRQEDIGSGNRITTFTYIFEALGANGGILIDTLLSTEYARFIKERNQINRTGKLFMYIPIFNSNSFNIMGPIEDGGGGGGGGSGGGGGGGGCGNASKVMYEQYELKNQKSLDTNVFFPERERMKDMLDTFINKKGRYNIPGYPYQLGILLHGPPGTGKTSIIKAIANHTRRHLIYVDLSRVTNNQQLTQIMFEEMRHVVNSDDVFKIPMNEVIFVLEDVDAASNVVIQRPSSSSSSSSSSSTSTESSIAVSIPMISSRPSSTSGGVTLAGLLNALDGPLDGPGRIIIMTSNYPERLDKALIRPGRIDLQVSLSEMSSIDAQRMVEHYVTQRMLTVEESNTFNTAYVPMTPAELQGICLSCQCLENVFSKWAATHSTLLNISK